MSPLLINTVLVQGTCTEYVTIKGFENLTVKSTSGATLVQRVLPTNNSFISLLWINSLRSVAIECLNFNSDSSKPPAIGIGAGSHDVRLRNLSIVGVAQESSSSSTARFRSLPSPSGMPGGPT